MTEECETRTVTLLDRGRWPVGSGCGKGAVGDCGHEEDGRGECKYFTLVKKGWESKSILLAGGVRSV